MRQFYPIQSGSDVAPRVAAGLFNDSLQQQRQYTQGDVCVHAMHRPVIPRTHPQAACERTPRLLNPLPWLVTQRQVGWRQAIVMALHHQWAVQLRFRAVLGRGNPSQPACGQAQIPTVTTARPQRTPPLAMALTPDLLQRGQLGLECVSDLAAMGALAFFLCGMVTHHVATTTCAFAHDSFLDAQVVRPRLVTPWTLEDLVGPLIPTAHRPTQEVLPPALAELLEVILGDHARIAHQPPPAQLPPAQVVLALGDGADIHGMARQPPGPPWQALARHGQPDDAWRGIRPAIVRQAPCARRLRGLGPRCPPACPYIVCTIPLVYRVDCHMPRRGSVAAQLSIEVEQVGKAAIQGWLDGILMGFEPIQRAGERLSGQRIRLRKAPILAYPLVITGEVGPGRTSPVGHHSPEGTCNSKVDLPVGEGGRDDLAKTEPRPEGLEGVEGPVGPGVHQAPRRGLRNHLFGGPAREDTAGQWAQALSALGRICPPTLGDKTDCGALFGGIPHARGHLKMGEERAIGSFVMGCASIHVCNDTDIIMPCQGNLYNPCI